MLSRKAVTCRGRRFRGYFPSRKLGRMVAWGLLIELDVIRILEFSSRVVFSQEQPARIIYCDGEWAREYYPDFEVIFDGGKSIHPEVKAAAELSISAVAMLAILKLSTAMKLAEPAAIQNTGRQKAVTREQEAQM